MEHETNCATSTDGEFCNNSGTVRVDSLEISDQGDETQTRSLDASPGPNSGVDNADKELNLPLQGDQPKTRDNIDDLGTEDLNSRVQLETASEHLGKQVETMQDHDEKSNESRPPGQTVTEGNGDREQDTTQNCHESFENSETAIRDSESSENKDLAPADLSGDEYETSETPLTVSAAMPHESANQIEAALVPSSSSASGTGNEADELPEAIRNHEEDTPSLYHIKWIKWKGINTPIVTQNENGPCPLLAIVNVLLLQRRINISSLQEIVTAGQLMEYIGDCILEEAPKRLSEGAQLNYEQNMHDAIAIMNKLQTGLDVNVKFTGVSDFEFTPECIVFDLLSIGLFHGWLIDPQNTHTVSAVGPLSYNQLVEKIIASKQDGAESQLQSEGLIGEAFLEQTASQLTYHGLCELNSQLQSDQLCVFFRNNHFSTLYKHKEELFLLVTDQGFLTEDRVIWESLSNVEGDSYFVNAEFRTLPAVTTNTPLNPGISQEDQDYLVALTLQEEQEHSARVAQGSGYPAGPVKPQPPLGQATPSVQQIQSSQEFTDLQLAMQLQKEEQRQQLRPEQQQQQQQQQRIPVRPQQGRIPASGAGSALQSQSRSTAHQRVESNEKCTIL